MTRLIILFLFFFQFANGQQTEQVALNYLLSNLSHQDIKFEDGHAGFNADTNMVWYVPRIVDGRGKIKIVNSYKASVDWFYKVVHDSHDIHIQTMKAKKVGTGFIVSFTITTTYGNFTNFDVLLDNNKQPLQIIRVDK